MNSYFQLVRLPAALSVPGDSLLGAAASGSVRPVRSAGLALSSALLYTAGMALNDYADREIDAEERPNRPIPSGRISATRALAVGAGLMASGVVVATAVDGRRGFVRSSTVAGAVLAYDFVAKGTPAGPVVMASCRFFDVLLGSTSVKKALLPASVVAAHTVAITGVSAFEVQGGTETVGKASAVATTAVAATALLTAKTRKVCSLATALAAVGVYATPSLQASVAAVRDPSPGRLQAIVGKGVMGMIPLQGALIAARGRTVLGAAVTGLWPIGRMLAKRRRVT
jgi:4-hydroxybenzoate polyprenyltransferase